jgi:hypothetical protein
VLELESAFFKGFEVYLFLNAKSGFIYGFEIYSIIKEIS